MTGNGNSCALYVAANAYRTAQPETKMWRRLATGSKPNSSVTCECCVSE
jgi:hypothetical protein